MDSRFLLDLQVGFELKQPLNVLLHLWILLTSLQSVGLHRVLWGPHLPQRWLPLHQIHEPLLRHQVNTGPTVLLSYCPSVCMTISSQPAVLDTPGLLGVGQVLPGTGHYYPAVTTTLLSLLPCCHY